VTRARARQTGRRLPRVSDGCASCFNGKIICRHILSPKIADWLCIAMLTSHNIEWKLTNGENVTIYGCNRPGPPEVTSSVVFPSEYQSSCRISWIHTRLTGLRSSIAVADCQQWLRFLFSVKNLSLNIATATLVAVDNTGETGGSQNDSLKVARTLPRPGRAIATANTQTGCSDFIGHDRSGKLKRFIFTPAAKPCACHK